MQLYPPVKNISYNNGAFPLNQVIGCDQSSFSKANLKELQSFLSVTNVRQHAHIIATYNPELHDEGYKLEINEHAVVIESKNHKGQLWALKTLKQIVKQSNSYLPSLVIEDEPVLSMRGYMLDIARGKIPKIETLKAYIDMLSDLKMNQFQLYIEGFAYKYSSFEEKYFHKQNALTKNDMLKLSRYANNKGIDLIPTHNTFGHMYQWLKEDAFKDLAIMKEGMMMWGSHHDPSTLNPLDPKSIEFVKKIIDDACLGSTSQYFNICFDEAYELGHGPTKEICEKEGIEAVFLSYLKPIYEHLKTKGKTVMMWGDFFNDHPNALKSLPKDIIVIDWGYDHYYPFHKRLKTLKDNKQPMLSSPGTSSWNSISGRTDDMFTNIQKAIEFTKRYQGLGSLLTDWGDHGHIQYPVISYPAIVYAALESWSDAPGHLIRTKDYLNQFIFYDDQNIFAQLTLDIGTYYHHQDAYTSNGTDLFKVFLLIRKHGNQSPKDFIDAALKLKYQKEHLKWIIKNNEDYLKRLKSIRVHKHFKHHQLELKQTINHVLIASYLLLWVKANDDEKTKTYSINKIEALLDQTMLSHQKLWLSKNQPSGLDLTQSIFTSIKAFIKNIKQETSL